jgi:glycosyltransferase involved in cell wall biosynthesis
MKPAPAVPRAGGVLLLGTSLQTMGGISSVLCVYRDHGLYSRWPLEHVVTHRDGSAFTKARTALAAFGAVASRLLFRRPALLHVHVSSRASFWRKAVCMAMARALRVPYLLHLHGSEFQQFYGRECGPRAQRIVSGFFDAAAHVVVLSAHWRDWTRGISRNPRIETIYNPVIVPSEPASPAAREPATLLFLGRLGHRKGTYDLLQALVGLRVRFPGVRVLLGGDGEVEAVRRRAEELGVAAHVELLGWVDAGRRAALLASSSAYVLPSYHEGLPMSVLEAMAAGLPIVSTPIGGIPEAVREGVEGLLVTPGDTAALEAALARLLADGELRRRMGEAARERVLGTFSADVIVPRIESLYGRYTVAAPQPAGAGAIAR